MKISKQLKTDITGYTFILPNIAGILAFTFFPLLFSLYISFTDWAFSDGLGNWSFNWGANYINMWKDRWFTDSLRNTILYAFSVVPLTIIIAICLAVIIDKYCYAKTLLKLSMFMPYVSNIVAIAVVWVMMYSPYGPITQFFKFMGWKNTPQWLGDYKWALPAVIVMSIWSNLGYCIMIYTSALSGLSKEIYEAAEVDGANEITKFFRITVHELSPTTFYLIITTFISSFQVFAPIQIMTRGGPGTSTHVLVYYMYTTAFTFFRMGYASSISWVLFLILIIITLIQWRGQKKWVSYR